MLINTICKYFITILIPPRPRNEEQVDTHTKKETERRKGDQCCSYFMHVEKRHK